MYRLGNEPVKWKYYMILAVAA